MLSQFNKFIHQQRLFEKTDKILLAVSGGIDSVVMCDLFLKAGLEFGIAHCNFGLRDAESDGDKIFVEQLATTHKAPFFSIRFNTAEYAAEKGISTQMAARDLRYKWFEEIRSKQGYQYIGVAHHKTDNVETILINMLRGTGISGLHGILPKNGKIIRPLLFTSHDEIDQYASDQNIAYRNDSSNDSDKYIRNKLRHHVLPVLREINNNLENTFIQNTKRIKGAEEIYDKAIDDIKKKVLIQSAHALEIDIAKLQQHSPLPTILFELLQPYGFNELLIKNIILTLNGVSGKEFTTGDYRLIKERNSLVINRLNKDDGITEYLIAEKQNILQTPTFELHIIHTDKDVNFTIPASKNIACFDARLLKFPLHLRKYKQGDYFYPLGMKGKKLLSDFFIDNKFSTAEKEDTWLLTSGNDIAWIIGKRVDNRYRINEQTNHICTISVTNL